MAGIEKRNSAGAAIGRALLLALGLSGLLGIAHYYGWFAYLNPAHLPVIQEKLAGLPWLVNRLLFVIGAAAAIVCGLGRSVISLAGGLWYGALQGTIISLLAALSGSLVVFAFVRRFGRPLFADRLSGYLKKADDLATRNGLLAVILIRQFPLSCLMINILLALTHIGWRDFILGSTLGFLPEALIFTLYGSSPHHNFMVRISCASLLLITVTIGVKLLLFQTEQNQPENSPDDYQGENEP